MSALGQKQTFAVQKGMSALPPKADMCGAVADVRFGPKADMCPHTPSLKLMYCLSLGADDGLTDIDCWGRDWWFECRPRAATFQLSRAGIRTGAGASRVRRGCCHLTECNACAQLPGRWRTGRPRGWSSRGVCQPPF